MKLKKTIYLRIILLSVILITFIVLCGIFIFQYKEFKDVEKRINTAYSNNSKLSPVLYQLFSTFSEADNMFRLYAITFEDENFKAYQSKLDTLNKIVADIDTIPNSRDSINKIKIGDHALAIQYIAIKKRIDELIVFADENMASYKEVLPVKRSKSGSADSIITRILNDSIAKVAVNADTIVKKKESLFNRIFNAKNDTVYNRNNSSVLSVNQIDILQKSIDNIIQTNQTTFNRSFRNLQRMYMLSKEKERKLITSNYQLLNDLKSAIDGVRDAELNQLRENERLDYQKYQENSQKFRYYAILALIVILLMLLFITYYQYVVSQYEKKILKEKDYASTIAEEKTNLLANISHEIRTPLNSLKGVIDILKVNQTKNEDIDFSILRNIEHDITVINNTVNDILNLSKIESGEMDVKLDDVYISKIINDTFSLHTYQAQSKGLKLINENKIHPIHMIKSNEFRLRQIISNLISNAIKYTNKGSVKIISNIVSDKVIINVIDTGIGIDKNKIDQVFRKYYMVGKDDKKVGFGLGLHISQLLAKQIKGKLSVKSQLGKGSTFTLQIPNERVLKPLPTENKLTEEKSSLSTDLSIVIIDDNKINLLITSRIFKDFENLASFEDTEKALEYISTNIPEVIITDIIMPKYSGWDILDYIKSNDRLRNIKVVAYTAERSMAEKGYTHSENSFDGILEKPFDLSTFSNLYAKLK